LYGLKAAFLQGIKIARYSSRVSHIRLDAAYPKKIRYIMRDSIDASIAELNRDLDEDGATPEDAEGEANQAALDAKEVVEKEQRLTADQHLTEAQKSASEQREAARLAFKKAQAQADKLCRLAPRGSQGEAYTAILQALFNDSIYGSSLADVAGAFKYPKVQGNQRDFVIGPVAGSNEGWFPR
jgi:hypothetical protein